MRHALCLLPLLLLSPACGPGRLPFAPSQPSGGCADPSLPAGVTTGSLQVNGVTRTYVLAVPDGDAHVPRPLVLGFHGSGSNGAGIRPYLGLEAPAAGAALFVYPDGLSDNGGATGWPDTGGRDIAFVSALIAHLEAAGCVDGARIFATGFSYGGYMSNNVGCKLAGTVRAIAPLSGGGPFGSCVDRPVAAWLAHGLQDGVVAPAQGEASRDHWLAQDHCGTFHPDVAPAPCQAYGGCDEGAPVVWCAFEGQHEVPRWVGPAVWSFFAQF